MAIGTVKSCGVVKINAPSGAVVWATRLRFDDGKELFAGLDNHHGKAAAEASHRNTFAVGIAQGVTLKALPEMHHPVTGAAKPLYQPLPDGWNAAN